MGSTIAATTTTPGIQIRRAVPADALPLSRICYDSFLAFNESVGIPNRLDFVNDESVVGMMKHMTSEAEVFGVVAIEESSGSIMAGGFITSGEMYEVGPIFANNAFKERGAAKAVMLALLEKARSDDAKSIRLTQVAANCRSFALYASLGFIPMDCWMDFEGCVTSEQATFASESVGYQSPTEVHVQKMEEADVDACNNLHIKVNGVGRKDEIRRMISGSWVATQSDQIIAYTTSFHLVGHSVAETEEAMVVLFTEVCRQSPPSDPPTVFHVLGRINPRLVQWALAAKLKLRRNCWLMVIGMYQSPQPNMAYCPSVNA